MTQEQAIRSGRTARRGIFTSWGEENDQTLDSVVAFLLAISPILQHYLGIGPIENTSLLILVLIFPYVLYKLVTNYERLPWKNLVYIASLLLFSLYKAFMHSVTFVKLAHGGITITIYVAAVFALINVSKFIQYTAVISLFASLLVSLQTALYYLFNFHLQLVPTALLLRSSAQWIPVVETGLIGINGVRGTLYRPSAFFLEPSHMFLYIFPSLFLLLLFPGFSRKKLIMSIILTIGLVLSTSGMGIVIAGFAWLIFFVRIGLAKNFFTKENLRKRKTIAISSAVLVGGVGFVFAVPFLRKSILRIFRSDSQEGSSAIGGRIKGSFEILRRLRGSGLLFGMEDNTTNIETNMSGFAATLYKWGIIGFLLSYGFYLQGLFFLKKQYIWLSCIILLVSFFSAHTHGTSFMIFYILFLIEGYAQAGRLKPLRKLRTTSFRGSRNR